MKNILFPLIVTFAVTGCANKASVVQSGAEESKAVLAAKSVAAEPVTSAGDNTGYKYIIGPVSYTHLTLPTNREV